MPTFHLQPSTLLFQMKIPTRKLTTLPEANEHAVKALLNALDVTAKNNQNITAAQRTLLEWHYRLGHVGMQQLQWMIRSSRLTVQNPQAVGKSTMKLPICASCQFGKMTKVPTSNAKKTGPSTSASHHYEHMKIKEDDLKPGQRVSVDQYVCALPGRLYSSRGGTRESEKYHGGTIFVDHASGYIHIQHQVSLATVDTLSSRLAFETEAYEKGIVIGAYHTDNGVFSSKQFESALSNDKQKLSFSGPGTGFQNAVAERAIRTIVTMARTMLLHAAMQNPKHEVNPDLWPMAMDYAVHVYNRLPRQATGLSPNEVWTRSIDSFKLTASRCHVWGAPTYTLSPKLQKSGGKIPKWSPRSRRGLFLGFSPVHSSSVPLILNLITHSITPQFHTIFDDLFTSVASNDEFDPKPWQNLLHCKTARLQISFDDDREPELADEWLTVSDLELKQEDQRLSTIQQQQQQRLQEASIERGILANNDLAPVTTSSGPSIPSEPSWQRVRLGNSTVIINDEGHVNRSNQSNTAQETPPIAQQAHESPPTLSQLSQDTMQTRLNSMDTNTSVTNVFGDSQPNLESVASSDNHVQPDTTSPTPILRRSTRTRQQASNFDPGSGEAASKWADTKVKALCTRFENANPSQHEQKRFMALLLRYEEATEYNPAVYAAKKVSDPDLPSYKEAMLRDDADKFWSAMELSLIHI